MNSSELLKILEAEIVPTIGCTEPAAIALTAAYAFRLVPGEVKSMNILVSPNVYKNTKYVGIPYTQKKGVKLAALLGIAITDPVLDLSIFFNMTSANVEKALGLLNDPLIKVGVVTNVPSVYIDIFLETTQGSSRAITSGRHTNLVFLKENENTIIDYMEAEPFPEEPGVRLSQYEIEEIITTILSIPASQLTFLLKGAELNMNMAIEGLDLDNGLKIGKTWNSLIKKGLVSNDLANDICYYTAAACDARMYGLPVTVMSTAGSGNHGLVAIIPIAIAARKLNCQKEKTAYALAISHLITLYIKEFTGRLSPICGCTVAAGSGASAGLTYLLGGSIDDISKAINNVISSLAGMICDGGKTGCALKLIASTFMAWQCAVLAIGGIQVPIGNGIVAANVKETLKNLGIVSQEGMAEVDKTLISILENQSY